MDLPADRKLVVILSKFSWFCSFTFQTCSDFLSSSPAFYMIFVPLVPIAFQCYFIVTLSAVNQHVLVRRAASFFHFEFNDKSVTGYTMTCERVIHVQEHMMTCSLYNISMKPKIIVMYCIALTAYYLKEAKSSVRYNTYN